MKRLFHYLLSVALLMPTTTAAQTLISDGAGGCDFGSGAITAGCIPGYVAYLIKTVFGFTGVVSLIVIMIGGYQYALGNVVGGKERGEQRIRWGIIGMIVSALSFFIVDFIISSIAGL